MNTKSKIFILFSVESEITKNRDYVFYDLYSIWIKIFIFLIVIFYQWFIFVLVGGFKINKRYR